MGIRFLHIKKKKTHTGVGMQNIVPNEIVNEKKQSWGKKQLLKFRNCTSQQNITTLKEQTNPKTNHFSNKTWTNSKIIVSYKSTQN